MLVRLSFLCGGTIRNIMTVDEIKKWDINAFEGCEIECPECKEWNSIIKWEEGEVPCETCGEHDAIICPECHEHFDHVWLPRFEVRETNQANLMAAAPTMYEALTEIAEKLDSEEMNVNSLEFKLWKIANDALGCANGNVL